MEVKIYSTEYCPACKAAKKYFDENDVKYKDYIIGENISHEEFHKATDGATTVPVIEIDGEQLIGFDLTKIRDKLNL